MMESDLAAPPRRVARCAAMSAGHSAPIVGVPEPRVDDVEVAAQMALALREEVRRLHWPCGDAMTVRIGLATGPAVAGSSAPGSSPTTCGATP